jgi:hypothetical protein
MTTHSPDPQPRRDTAQGSASSPGTSPLFAGVGDLCDDAAQDSRTDGAALAVLTRQAHSRELIYATDPLAQQLDELQYTLGEGPCFDAYLHDTPQFHPNLDSTTQTSRWPTFAAEATRLGVHSVFAFPVPGPRRLMGPSGVLEFYRRATGTLTDTHTAAATAGAAAISLRLQSNWDDHLVRFRTTEEAIDAAAATEAALDEPADPFTRSQIHVAAGMLANRLRVHPNEAVDRLRAHSYASGRRISSVAADIIACRLTLHDHTDPPHQ